MTFTVFLFRFRRIFDNVVLISIDIQVLRDDLLGGVTGRPETMCPRTNILGHIISGRPVTPPFTLQLAG